MPDSNGYRQIPEPEDTLSETLRVATETYIAMCEEEGIHPAPKEAEAGVLSNMLTMVLQHNSTANKKAMWNVPSKLPNASVAMLMVAFNHVINVDLGPDNGKLVAIYMTEGDKAGLYSTDPQDVRKVAQQYNFVATPRDIEQELIPLLGDFAPVRPHTSDPHLMAVKNGVFDDVTKELVPFDPDKYVFLHKCSIGYNPNAMNVKMPDGWDVVSWIEGLSDDPDIVKLLWELIAAVVRPNGQWDVCAFFYNPDGSAGKGTFCKMLENLVGKDATAFLSVKKMTQQFSFDGLERRSLIIGHENSVNKFLDEIEDFKAVVTSDAIMVDRKHRAAYAMEFHGTIIQCFNSMPRIGDHSGSFYRRIRFIPFTKSFREGNENKDIKHVYLAREDVLEYVMKVALEMNLDAISEPDACLRLKHDTEAANNTVVEFADEILSQATWEAFPYIALYDLYVAWHNRNNQSSRPMKSRNFREEIERWCRLNPESGWECPASQFFVQERCDDSEPLFADYDVQGWVNPHGKNRIARGKVSREIPDRVRGIRRMSGWTAADVDDNGEEESEE